MHKKLLAVAVAGALGAPALAVAQSSTVQIFGTVYVEYTFRADQGDAPAGPPFFERTTADFLQTPGSEIGFKGEEKLGGGLSAWFQCSTTADPRGQSQNGFCSRNSALGFKGGFGNVFVGSWDMPFKRSQSPTMVGGNATGIFGTTFLLTGGSTTTSFPNAATGSPASAARGIFHRRQNSSIHYETPNFGGFQVMTAFTPSQPSTGTLDAANNNKPRIYSLGAQYSAGPIYVSAGYERHQDANGAGAIAPPAAGTARNGDDDGWHVGAAYTWGPVRIGGTYTRQEVELGTTAAPTEVKYRAWQVGVDWRIVGPHGLRAAYTKAQDTKGTGTSGPVGGSGVTRPGFSTAVGANNNNGADMMQIRYVYTFSKRTEFTLGYVRLENDSAGTYNLGGLSTPRAGEEQNAWALAVRHTF